MKPQKKVNYSKIIQSFLKACGFECIDSGGFCEFLKEIKGDDLYVYQINGEDISQITTPNELVIFSENGKDPDKTPMYRYCKEYPNFKSMVEGESKRGIDFSKGNIKTL